MNGDTLLQIAQGLGPVLAIILILALLRRSGEPLLPSLRPSRRAPGIYRGRAANWNRGRN
jgi:hypothetical protein